MVKNAAIFLAVLLANFVVSIKVSAQEPANIFFSEYIEGSSNNKALEIYNPTSSTVNLAEYKIKEYFNGSATAGNTIILPSLDLATGETYVICNSAINASVLSKCNSTATTLQFNGDDAISLENSTGGILDIIGQIGFDPGTQWGSGEITTLNHTLTRKPEILTGDTNGSDVFDPTLEWDGHPADTFSFLGTHQINSQPSPTPTEIPTPTPTATVIPTPTPTATPSAMPTPDLSPSPTPTPSVIPTTTPTQTPSSSAPTPTPTPIRVCQKDKKSEHGGRENHWNEWFKKEIEKFHIRFPVWHWPHYKLHRS